jgi:hypothetical protein
MMTEMTKMTNNLSSKPGVYIYKEIYRERKKVPKKERDPFTQAQGVNKSSFSEYEKRASTEGGDWAQPGVDGALTRKLGVLLGWLSREWVRVGKFHRLGGRKVLPSYLGREEDMELLNPKDVSRLLKCSLPWVYKASEAGLLPSIRIPCAGNGKREKHMVRFELESVRAFIEKHRQCGKST